LRQRIDAYRVGQVLAGALLLTAGVDVQGDRLEITVKGWGRGEESWLVDWQQIFGDPSQIGPGSVWEELAKLLDKGYPHAGGATLRIRAMAVDSGGHHTQEVYANARAHRRRHVIAINGQSKPGRPILGRPSAVDFNFRGQVVKHGVKLWPVGSDTAKTKIYNRLKITEPGADCMHFPAGLPDNYFAQLTAEKQVKSYVNGFERFKWVKDAGVRNEAIDCEVYAYAAAIYCGITRMNWDLQEQLINPTQRDIFTEAAHARKDTSSEAAVRDPEPAHDEAGSGVVQTSAEAPDDPPPPPQKIETSTEAAASGLFHARRKPRRPSGFVNAWR
jgi:phage terminase large subunit GpA-like protein